MLLKTLLALVIKIFQRLQAAFALQTIGNLGSTSDITGSFVGHYATAKSFEVASVRRPCGRLRLATVS